MTEPVGDVGPPEHHDDFLSKFDTGRKANVAGNDQSEESKGRKW